MAELQKFFPPTTPIAIASFNFTDIAEGTGVINFKGFGMIDNSGTTYGLTTQSLFGEPIETESIQIDETNFTVVETLNFDLTVFNTPKIIKGTALVELSWGLVTTSSKTHTIHIVITYQHYDGSSYTDIGTAQTANIVHTSSTTTIKSSTIDSLLTRTHFKGGDSLRIKVELIGKVSTAGGDGEVWIAHDPQNRDGTFFTATNNHTTLNFYIPFQLDL